MRTYVEEFTERLVIKLRPEDKGALQDQARSQGVSVSTLVRDALGLQEPVEPLRKHS
jgi:hypothetical protein